MYRSIKNYNREEMETFLETVYKDAYSTGIESVDNTDLKSELLEILKETKGIGEKTTENILETMERLGK